MPLSHPTAAGPWRGRRQCTVCHEWKPAHRIWKTGACFLCVEFATPISTPLAASSAGPHGLISAVATSEASARLAAAHAALQEVRHQLAEDARRAGNLAARQEQARVREAEARELYGQLAGIDQLELIAQAPDVERQHYRRELEP